MSVQETPFVLSCENRQLLGIVHQSSQPRDTGVMIVVGGPQYRVGSHRQFLLLARYLADNHIPVMRFDYRGMGDSEGDDFDFEHAQDDVAAFMDEFTRRCPEVKNVVIWGLCDAASVACLYAYKDARVKGQVLLNPWVRTAQGEAKAYVKHYYVERLKDPEFWKKLFTGKMKIFSSLTSFLSLWKQSRSGINEEQVETQDNRSLPERMADAEAQFDGKTLYILSCDNDLVASEFIDLCEQDAQWKALLNGPQSTVFNFPGANHTFSKREWRDEVAKQTLQWVNANFPVN